MTPDLLLEIGITPALNLLPETMDSVEAQALLLAIALQESECEHRRQHPDGPGRSYYQYEPKENQALAGVLRHPKTALHAANMCRVLDIEHTTRAVYTASEFHDVLASAFARLLLWTDPTPLPKAHEIDLGWNHYLSCWQPGHARPERWPSRFVRAWEIVRAA